MKVKIYGTGDQTYQLKEKILKILEELGLQDFIPLEETQDEALKKKLEFQKEPALIIEEESIDFQDVIFEGIVPKDEELKSMFVSLIGGGTGGCAPEGCGSGCSC